MFWTEAERLVLANVVAEVLDDHGLEAYCSSLSQGTLLDIVDRITIEALDMLRARGPIQ